MGWSVKFTVEFMDGGDFLKHEWSLDGLEDGEASRFKRSPLAASRRFLREIESRMDSKEKENRELRVLSKDLNELQKAIRLVGATNGGGKLVAKTPMIIGVLAAKGIPSERALELLGKVKDSGMCEFDEQLVAVSTQWLSPSA